MYVTEILREDLGKSEQMEDLDGNMKDFPTTIEQVIVQIMHATKAGSIAAAERWFNGTRRRVTVRLDTSDGEFYPKFYMNTREVLEIVWDPSVDKSTQK
jgi:hypothetical protein